MTGLTDSRTAVRHWHSPCRGEGLTPREVYFSDRKKELCPNTELPNHDTH